MRVTLSATSARACLEKVLSKWRLALGAAWKRFCRGRPSACASCCSFSRVLASILPTTAFFFEHSNRSEFSRLIFGFWPPAFCGARAAGGLGSASAAASTTATSCWLPRSGFPSEGRSKDLRGFCGARGSRGLSGRCEQEVAPRTIVGRVFEKGDWFEASADRASSFE